MRTTRTNWKLFAAIFLGIAAPTASGCATDWFRSPSADYAKSGEYSRDVSDLPDPSAPTPPRVEETTFRNPIAAQYGAAPTKESPERLLLQANAYFDQKRYHDSARLYKKYLATPEAQTATAETLATAHYRIGFVARKKLEFDEAKREYQTALQYAPKNDEIRFALGKSCFDATDFANADAAFAALLANNPNYPEAQYYYGLTLLEGTRRAEALRPLTLAVGELQANALLTDKYYAVGELALATRSETQTARIAARLGKALPELPHKIASSEAIAANDSNSTPNPNPVAPTERIQQTAAAAPTATVRQTATAAPTATVRQAATVSTPAIAQNSPSVATETPAPTFASRLTPRLASAVATTPTEIEKTESTPTTSSAVSDVPPSRLLLPALAETLARTKRKNVETNKIDVEPVENADVSPNETPRDAAPQPDATAANSASFAAAAFDATRRTADAIFSENVAESNVAKPLETEPEETNAETRFDAEPSLNQNFVVADSEPTSTAQLAARPNDAPLDAAFPFVDRPETPALDAAPPLETPNDVQEIEALLAAETPVEPAPVAAPLQVGRRNPGLFAASDATPDPAERAAFKPGSIGTCETDETTSPAPISVAPPTDPIVSTVPMITEPARFFAADARAALEYVDVFETAERLVDSFRTPDVDVATNAPLDRNETFNENDEFAFASSGSANRPAEPVSSPVAVPVADAVAPPYPQATVATEPPTSDRTNAPKSSSFAAYRKSSTPEERLEAARAAGAEVRELTPKEYRRAVAAGLSKGTTTK